MTKALTYYELKKDEVGKTLTKTQLIKEAAKATAYQKNAFAGESMATHLPMKDKEGEKDAERQDALKKLEIYREKKAEKKKKTK